MTRMWMKNRTRKTALFAALALAGATACQTLESLGLSQPSLALRGTTIEGFSLESSTLVFEVEVQNPYGVALPLLDWGYALTSGGAPFLDGTVALEGSVPARGSRSLSLPVVVNHLELLRVLGDLRPGRSVPWEAELEFAVDAPGGQRLSFPLRRSGTLPVPAVPEVSLAKIRWSELGLSGATGTVVLELANPNDFGLDLSRLALALELGGRKVATLAAQPGTALAADGSASVELPLSVSLSAAGLGLLDTLRGNSASYGLRGDLEVGTPYGPLALPLEASGRALLE